MVVVANVVAMEQVEIVVNPWIIASRGRVIMFIMDGVLKEYMDRVEAMVMAKRVEDRVKDKEVVVVRVKVNIKEGGVAKEKEEEAVK